MRLKLYIKEQPPKKHGRVKTSSRLVLEFKSPPSCQALIRIYKQKLSPLGCFPPSSAVSGRACFPLRMGATNLRSVRIRAKVVDRCSVKALFNELYPMLLARRRRSPAMLISELLMCNCSCIDVVIETRCIVS